MRKLSEIQDDEAMDLLADIMDPLVDICSDPKIKEMSEGEKKATKLEIIKYIMKNHKEPLKLIMAKLEGVPVEEYHYNVLTLPLVLLEIFNEPEVAKLFT